MISDDYATDNASDGTNDETSEDAWNHLERTGYAGAAAITHKGVRHERNQDSFALFQRNTHTFGIVCDGISATPSADVASRIAALAAGHAFLRTSATSPAKILTDCWISAQNEVTELSDKVTRPPSTTFAAVLITPTDITSAWTGDSRIYWFPSKGQPRLLTHDHNDRRGRLTSWVGAGSPTTRPATMTIPKTDDGIVLLCTDGLWKYAPSPDHLASLRKPVFAPVAQQVRQLLRFAVNAGGADDITIVAIPVERTSP